MKKNSFILSCAVLILLAVILCSVLVSTGCRKDDSELQENEQVTEQPEEKDEQSVQPSDSPTGENGSAEPTPEASEPAENVSDVPSPTENGDIYLPIIPAP